MDIALMNVMILFQKNAVQTDKIGNHTNAWEDYYSCHATVSGEGGTEKTVAGLVVDDSDISFSVRYGVMNLALPISFLQSKKL